VPYTRRREARARVQADPVVLLHAEVLMTSSPEGATTYLEGDGREPEKILAAAEILDFGKPVAVLLFGACTPSPMRRIRAPSSGR
jgi:hypothetical protein